MSYTSIFKKWINSIGKNRLFFFISHLLYNLFLFIISIIAAKLSGPKEWGVITLLLLLSTYSSLFTLGINNGLGIKLPLVLGQKKYLNALEIQSIGFTALFLTLLPIGFAQFIFTYFWNKPISVWLILFSYTFSFQILTYLKIQLRSYEYFGLFSVAYIFQTLSISIGILGLIKGYHYLIITSIGNLIASLFIWIKLPEKPSIKFNLKSTIVLIQIGFPIMMAGIVGELLLSVDRILISIVFDDIQLGYYGFSANLFKGIRVIGIAISMLILPLIVKSYAIKEYSNMLKYAKIQQWYSFILMASASLIIGILSYNLIPDFFPEYKNSIFSNFILMGVASLLPFSFYPNILNTIGQQKFYLLAQLFGILMNIIISSIFILLGFGINGIATASFISMVCYVVFIRKLGKKALKKSLEHA